LLDERGQVEDGEEGRDACRRADIGGQPGGGEQCGEQDDASAWSVPKAHEERMATPAPLLLDEEEREDRLQVRGRHGAVKAWHLG